MTMMWQNYWLLRTISSNMLVFDLRGGFKKMYSKTEIKRIYRSRQQVNHEQNAQHTVMLQ